ncbi:MAG: hypothetical protein QOF51_1411 [Chloroflexota bacterium]|nr:hypothetical protein [Chloroflexota bacterium]
MQRCVDGARRPQLAPQHGNLGNLKRLEVRSPPVDGPRSTMRLRGLLRRRVPLCSRERDVRAELRCLEADLLGTERPLRLAVQRGKRAGWRILHARPDHARRAWVAKGANTCRLDDKARPSARRRIRGAHDRIQQVWRLRAEEDERDVQELWLDPATEAGGVALQTVAEYGKRCPPALWQLDADEKAQSVRSRGQGPRTALGAGVAASGSPLRRQHTPASRLSDRLVENHDLFAEVAYDTAPTSRDQEEQDDKNPRHQHGRRRTIVVRSPTRRQHRER